MLLSTTTFAASGDPVQLVDVGASNFTSKLNSNNLGIFITEPNYVSTDGPYGTSMYKSGMYNDSVHFGEISFYVNGSGYISAMIINTYSRNENELLKGTLLVDYALEVIGLDSRERYVLFENVEKYDDDMGSSMCVSTSRFVNVMFKFDNNIVRAIFTASEP